MGAEVIILANPYTYNFLKGLTHSAVVTKRAPVVGKKRNGHLFTRTIPNRANYLHEMNTGLK